MQSQPTPQHQWLQKLIGNWSFEGTPGLECPGPAGSEHATARESVRALGDLWIVAELKGKMPGCDIDMTCITTLGFDPAKGKFVGSWIGTPMAMMFVYEGELSADGSTLSLACTGPAFDDPTKTANYRDNIQFVSADERNFFSEVQQQDGSWKRFMQGVHRRIK